MLFPVFSCNKNNTGNAGNLSTDELIDIYVEYNISPENSDVHKISKISDEKIIALDSSFNKCWLSQANENFEWQLQEGWAANITGIEYIEDACMLNEDLMLAWAYIDEQPNIIIVQQNGNWVFFEDKELTDKLKASSFAQAISIKLLDDKHLLLHYKETTTGYTEAISIYEFDSSNGKMNSKSVFNYIQSGVQDITLLNDNVYILDPFGEIYSFSLKSNSQIGIQYAHISDLNGVGLKLASANNEIYCAGKNSVEYYNTDNEKGKLFNGLGKAFSKSTATISNFLPLDKNNIIISTQDIKGQAFLYKKEKQSASYKNLNIFCITDNKNVVNAANAFSVQNPNVHLEYENIDWAEYMAKGTAYLDDIIRNLNIQIAAGKGPDILLLDFLPINSYKKQDIFLDLKPLVDTSDIYDEYLEPFMNNGKIHMLPASASFYVLTGQNGFDKDISFEDMQSYVNEYNSSDTPLFLSYNKQNFELVLRGSSMPAFIENNSVNSNVIENYYAFLEQFSNTVNLIDINSLHPNSKGLTREISSYALYPSYDISCYYSMAGECSFGATLLSSIDELVFFQHPELFFDYSTDLSAVNTSLFPGISKGAWYPEGIMAISSACKEPELAAKFIQCMLAPEIQGEINNDYISKGMPVTKQGAKMQLEQIEALLNSAFENSSNVNLTDTYSTLVEQLGEPIFPDLVLEEILSEIATKLYNGQISPYEAAASFEEQVNIYLMEKK